MFYKHYEQKPLSEANKVYSDFSEVQSGLCQTVRQIISNPIAYGQGHQILDSDVIPPQYDNLSVTEQHKRFTELQAWAKTHPEEIEALKNPEPKPELKTEPKPELPSK